MRTQTTELSTLLLLFDLILTQSIERYSEMKPEEAHKAIRVEWKDQAGVLLRELFFGNRRERPRFRHRARRDGNGTYLEPCRRALRQRPSFPECRR